MKTKAESSREHQGLTFCLLEKQQQPLRTRTSKKWCSICNHKIKGARHEEGYHHLRAAVKLEKAK